MNPKKPKGLGLGFGFSIFGYLGFGFEYFANLEYDNLKYKKQFLVFRHGFEYYF
jgi:hypothetical protein